MLFERGSKPVVVAVTAGIVQMLRATWRRIGFERRQQALQMRPMVARLAIGNAEATNPGARRRELIDQQKRVQRSAGKAPKRARWRSERSHGGQGGENALQLALIEAAVDVVGLCRDASDSVVVARMQPPDRQIGVVGHKAILR